jgi:hypothetical protein
MCNVELDKNSPIGQWAIWLDHRNEARAIYLAGTIEGRYKKDFEGVPLADNLYELRKIVANRVDLPIVQSKDDLWNWIQSRNASEHPLRRLAKIDVEAFFSTVRFADYIEEDVRYRHFSTLYFGDLFKKHHFGYAELFEIMALFGMSAAFTIQSSDRFGCTADPGDVTCQPRLYYSCSGADC